MGYSALRGGATVAMGVVRLPGEGNLGASRIPAMMHAATVPHPIETISKQSAKTDPGADSSTAIASLIRFPSVCEISRGRIAPSSFSSFSIGSLTGHLLGQFDLKPRDRVA